MIFTPGSRLRSLVSSVGPAISGVTTSDTTRSSLPAGLSNACAAPNEGGQALSVLAPQDPALPGVVSGLRRLVGAPWSACLRGRRHVLDGRDVARQEDAECRAFADGRFRIDEAAGLLDDAVDGGKTEPGALADFFRR